MYFTPLGGGFTYAHSIHVRCPTVDINDDLYAGEYVSRGARPGILNVVIEVTDVEGVVNPGIMAPSIATRVAIYLTLVSIASSLRLVRFRF